jgi:tetratricopeptide (TPR) repeat protein
VPVPVALAQRIVEVIADRGDFHPRYRYGSGCIVRGRIVLTAGHVVAGAQTVQVRNPDKALWPARLDREFVSETAPDLALVFIEDDGIDLPAMELGVVDRYTPQAPPVKQCRAVGYPWFAKRKKTHLPTEVRNTVDVWGDIPVLSHLADGLLTLQVTVSPRALPPGETALGDSSEWSGMSGAPVMTEDGCLLGVVIEHAPREGESAITVVPLSALEPDPAHEGWGSGVQNASRWWQQLGVAGLTELRRLPEQTTPGPLPTPAAVRRTLPTLARRFTDREKQLAAITGAVTDGEREDEACVYAIDGMPGVGKSAFAVEAADQLRKSPYFPDGLLYINLHGNTPGQNPVEPAEALRALLTAMGMDAKQIPPSLEERAAAWADLLAGKKLLLLLDDAANSTMVRPLLPGTAETMVLITSRRRLTALPEADTITLDILQPGDAAQLFVRLARRGGLEPTDDGVAEVVRLCGYLPLAISLMAGQFQHRPTWTTRDLIGSLTSASGRLKALSAEDRSVAAAFDVSYRQLTPDQQRVFRAVGLHPGTDIDPYAAAALVGTDLDRARSWLENLYDYNLIEQPTAGRYRLHDLLRELARTLAANEEPAERERATGRLLDYYLYTATIAGRYLARHTLADSALVVNPPAWIPELPAREPAILWLEDERVNLFRVVDLARTTQPGYAIGISAALAGFLRVRGYWGQALSLHQSALAAARGIADQKGEADVLNNLGGVQQAMGDYPAATTHHEQALALYRDLQDQQGEADALSDLAIVQRLTGDYAGVKSGLTRAQSLYHDLGDRLGEAKSFNDLGIVYRLTGDYEAAETNLKKALELHRELGNRLGEGNALDDLGIVYRLTGNYEAAEASLKEVLDLREDIRSPHVEANAWKELGVVYRLTGKYTDATRSLDKALKLYRELHDRNCEAETLNNYGQLYSASEAPAEARVHFGQALQIARDLKVPLEEARALEGTGETYRQEGNTKDSTTSLQEALGIYRRLGSPDGDRVEAILRERGSSP